MTNNAHSSVSRFEQALIDSMDWLREVQEELDLEEQETYQCLHAVLHALRDRLPSAEVAVLGRGLPMVVRGIFYEGWVPTIGVAAGSEESFLAAVDDALKREGLDVDPRQAAGSVLRVLGRRVPKPDLDLVAEAAPRDFRDFLAA